MMAFSTRSSIFIFFTTLVLLSTQIHARDSYFFGKFSRDTPKDQSPNNVAPLETSEKTSVEETIPNKKEQEQEQDPTFIPQSENGYGLYGHETSYNSKEEFNNNNKYDDKFNGETFSTPSLSQTEESYNNYEEKYPKKSYESNNEEFNNKNNNEEFNNYNNDEFNNKNNKVYNNEEFNNKYDENVKEESFPENNEEKRGFYNSNAYGTELERETETPYKGYSHNLERQGMSDTRFMEKGNYYYDLYNDRNHGNYYRKHHQKSPSGYYTSPANDNNNYEQSYSYENNNYKNNNNNMEEKSFKDPYDSKWEKNMMNEQPEEFNEEQVDHFKP